MSGFLVFVGGLSWEGFGVFILATRLMELWKFCTTDTEKHLLEYTIWVAMCVPGLYLISPVCQNGIGFATHLKALVLGTPLIVFVLRGAGYILI